MFANGDDDLQGACKADELAGVGDDGDGEMRRSASHDAAVLKKEGAAAAAESAGSAFDGDINTGTRDIPPSELSSVLKAGSRGAVLKAGSRGAILTSRDPVA